LKNKNKNKNREGKAKWDDQVGSYRARGCAARSNGRLHWSKGIAGIWRIQKLIKFKI
jgi:hypothetical protein